MFERFDEAKTEKRQPNHRSRDTDRHYLTAVAVGAAVRVDRNGPFDDPTFDGDSTGDNDDPTGGVDV